MSGSLLFCASNYNFHPIAYASTSLKFGKGHVMIVVEDIRYVGVDDHTIDLFEGMYEVPNGMTYNSYIILDEKIAVMDTMGEGFANLWLDNIENALEGRKPDYLIVQHMEPDHSANIVNFVEKYPEAVLVASAKAFGVMMNFFGTEFTDKRLMVADGDELLLGKHNLVFVSAPMVHWPEVIVTYDSTAKVLFSADGFGKFGALDAEEEWTDEARRYYFGIVGKYGLYVQKLLKKLADKELRTICPLHGPVLSENLEYYLDLYNTWSAYEPEEDGVLIAYTSIYGNTRKAVRLLEEKLLEKGCLKVVVRDLARCDMSEAVAEAFRYSKLVLATTTYNADIFPFMREFLNWLTERYFCNRMVAFMENGSWAIVAAKLMREKLEKSKGLIFADTSVRIQSAINEENRRQIELLAEELCREVDA